MVQTIIIKEIG